MRCHPDPICHPEPVEGCACAVTLSLQFCHAEPVEGCASAVTLSLQFCHPEPVEGLCHPEPVEAPVTLTLRVATLAQDCASRRPSKNALLCHPEPICHPEPVEGCACAVTLTQFVTLTLRLATLAQDCASRRPSWRNALLCHPEPVEGCVCAVTLTLSTRASPSCDVILPRIATTSVFRMSSSRPMTLVLLRETQSALIARPVARILRDATYATRGLLAAIRRLHNSRKAAKPVEGTATAARRHAQRGHPMFGRVTLVLRRIGVASGPRQAGTPR